MIKLKQKIKSCIAMILILAISLTAIPVTPVFAAGNDTTVTDAIDAVADAIEEIAEAKMDSISRGKRAGDWRYPIYVDHLPWNYFHNAVQKDIVERYKNVGMGKELTIENVYKNGKPTNKYGRADLYMEKDDGTYLWEVKPNSYSEEPKQSIGVAQLYGYVLSKDIYKIGTTKMIQNGQTVRIISNVNADGFITYIIKYEVQENGLILYTFERYQSGGEDANPQEVPDTVFVTRAEVEQIEEMLRGDIPVVEEDLDITQLFKLVIIASSWGSYNEVLNSNPETRTSVSEQIAFACNSFLLSLLYNGAGSLFTCMNVEAKEYDAAKINQAIDDFMTVIELFGGEELGEEISEALLSEDEESVEELLVMIQAMNENYEKAGEAQPPRDPLVIDLGESGIKLHSLDNGVYFDLDNNGFAEKTAWIDVEDGFLALDRNSNGIIENGGELFGDQAFLQDGTRASSGFEALSEFDENQDKIIDNEDSVFEELVVWMDANHNGISESDELKTLNELGIISISLEHEERSLVDDETGTRIAETAYVKKNTDGVLADVEISEFWFPINSSDTTHGGTTTAGNVPNIIQAIEDDETGELYELVCAFSESEDIAQKRYYVQQILYFITGAADIEVNSRGGNIDARNLKVIEEFMGREFVGVDGTSPNTNAAGILNAIFKDIEDQYYNILNIYTAFGTYLKLAYEYEDENGNEVLDLTYLKYLIDTEILNGENADVPVYDLGVYLKSYDRINGTNYYKEYSEYYAAISSHYADIVEMTKSSTTYFGTDKNDIYGGTSDNDFIFGQEGNDLLNGGVGNDMISGGEDDDILDGGIGNDTLKGDAGNDIYLFTRGYGNDTIMDHEGSSTIRFTNIHSKDILVNGNGENDVIIKIKGTNDTLLIKDFCLGEEFADFTLEFRDKTVHCNDPDSPFQFISGSDSDDTLKAVIDDSVMHAFGGNDTVIASKGSDIIYGNDGDDSITAGEGNDTVYGGSGDDSINGEAGDDIIFGEAGQDLLDGGSGNDYIFGGSGDDTYMFGRDYGTDIIEDSEGVSTIKLEDALSVNDVYVFRLNNEAVINIKDTKDRLIISGFGNNAENYVLSVGGEEMQIKDIISDTIPEEIEDVTCLVGTDDSDALFAENTENMITSGDQYDYIVGGDNIDVIFGDGDTDRISAGIGNDIIFGSEGSDQLFGEADNDLIAGGAGNDYISSGDGDDIIISGEGADLIDGSSGDDTYYFNIGDGNDTIMDAEGMNTIIFGDNIYSSGIKAYRENWNDLLITFEDSNDTITIRDYCINENARNFKFVFADGTVFHATDADSLIRTINDNAGTEYIPSIYEDGIVIISSDGDDEITGSDKDDILIGGAGNNRITGKAGNDVIDGGMGRDYLNGGTGSDTYVYKKGYGSDTINDSEGVNYIEISEYALSDMRAYRTNWNDITLVLDGSGEQGLQDDTADKITLEGFYISEANRNFYLSFNGSRIQAAASSSPLRIIYGTGDSEYMQGFDNSNFTLYGVDGTDTLNGGDSSDYLYGGSGDDRLLGFSGNDVLNGESGNDYLEGGSGNDTYIFNMGSGTDLINDDQGTNRICFGEGLNKDTLTAYRTDGNDLTITFEGVEDRLIIQNYFISESNRVFDVAFADGSSYTYDDLENPVNQVYATDNDDWSGSWSDKGIWLNGAAGNDNITGGAGDDVLSGGTGNDTLSGGTGDDSYNFGLGDGFDVITDTEGVNKIVFRNINSDNVVFTYEIGTDIAYLTISVQETGEGIVINNYNEENFVLEFSDGTVGKVVVEDSAASFVQITD